MFMGTSFTLQWTDTVCQSRNHQFLEIDHDAPIRTIVSLAISYFNKNAYQVS
jgi:hypothetical protein